MEKLWAFVCLHEQIASLLLWASVVTDLDCDTSEMFKKCWLLCIFAKEKRQLRQNAQRTGGETWLETRST